MSTRMSAGRVRARMSSSRHKRSVQRSAALSSARGGAKRLLRTSTWITCGTSMAWRSSSATTSTLGTDSRDEQPHLHDLLAADRGSRAGESRAGLRQRHSGFRPAETDTPTIAVSGLSDISNDAEAEVVISVSDGVLEAASWRDLYLLLRYEVVVNS